MVNRLPDKPQLAKRIYDGYKQIWIAYVVCSVCKCSMIKHDCNNLYEAMDECRLLDALPVCLDCCKKIYP